MRLKINWNEVIDIWRSLKTWNTSIKIKRRTLKDAIHSPFWKLFEIPMALLRTICAMQTWFWNVKRQKNSYALFYLPWIGITKDSLYRNSEKILKNVSFYSSKRGMLTRNRREKTLFRQLVAMEGKPSELVASN